jgi:hypothetical protein
MKTAVLRSGIALVASTTLLLTAGCAADGAADTADEPTTSATAEQSEQSQSADGPVEVPDVTLLILETAMGNLMRAGLTAEAVDETGAPVPQDDLTAWVVTAQDPADGTVDAGTAVTLTVKPRG